MSVFVLVLILLVCGVIIGFIAGLIGVGGGGLVTPLLRVGFGLNILTSTATSLFTILPTSLAGVIGHLKNHTCNVKIGLLIGLFGAVVSPLGAMLAGRASSTVLSICTAIVIAIPAVQIIISSYRQMKHGTTQEIPDVTWRNTKLDFKTVAWSIPAGALSGFCAGFCGIGGGFLVVPVLVSVLGMEMHEVAGTSALSIFVSCVPGAVMHAVAGDISWLYGLAIIVGSIPGAWVGARFSRKVPALQLKIIFGAMLGACALAIILV